MEIVKKEILSALLNKLDDATNPLPYQALQALCSLFGLSAKQTREKLKESLGEFLLTNSDKDLEIVLDNERDEKTLLFLLTAHEQGVLRLGVVEKVVVPEPVAEEAPKPAEQVVTETTPKVAEKVEVEELPPLEIKSMLKADPKAPTLYEHRGLRLGAVPKEWHRFIGRIHPVQIERIRKSVESGLFVGQHISGIRVTGNNKEFMIQGPTGIVFFWNDVV
jgi:hypothetical protein